MFLPYTPDTAVAPAGCLLHRNGTGTGYKKKYNNCKGNDLFHNRYFSGSMNMDAM